MTEWDKTYPGFTGDDLIRVVAADLFNKLQAINLKLVKEERRIMTTVDEIQARADQTLAAVQADTAIDTAVAKIVNDQVASIQALRDQLAAAGTDPVKLQTLADTMDAILASSTSNSEIVSAAVVAGTPVVPSPAPDVQP